MIRSLLLLVALASAAEVPPESDDANRIGLHGIEAATDIRKAWSWREPDARSTELRVAELRDGRWTPPRTVVAEGNPDRPALSPDGGHLAFVSGATGLPSVYVIPFVGGTPRQLTNVGLRTGSGRPDGFVPPPHDDSLRFDGHLLRWTSPEGTHHVEWR